MGNTVLAPLWQDARENLWQAWVDLAVEINMQSEHSIQVWDDEDLAGDTGALEARRNRHYWMRITSTISRASVKVFVNDILHVHFMRDKFLGLQAYQYEAETMFYIDITLTSGCFL